jgi:prepilin-type N-terminal cleavage/methylation domain-containing protein
MTPGPARRRGFTLLEVMLAAILGSMILLACVGLFGAIDRQTLAGRDRFTETLELSTTHATAERAIQLLVMSDSPAPVEPSTRDRTEPDPADPDEPDEQDPDAPAASDDPTAPPLPSDPPRFDLAFDPVHSGSMEVVDQQSGRVRVIPPQRLEVALRSPPIFVPTEPRAGDDDPQRESRRERRERRAREDAEVEDPALVEIAIAPGVRGAFELVQVPGDPYGDYPDGTWELWWRQLTTADGPAPIDSGADEMIWPEGMAPGAVRLASDLTRVHWQVFRGNEWRDEWTATWTDDLPAYVQLEVQTVHGTNHQWLLEVGWTTGKDPGTQTTTPLQPSDPNNPTDPNNPNGQNQQRPGETQPLPAGARRGGRAPASGKQPQNNPGGGSEDGGKR